MNNIKTPLSVQDLTNIEKQLNVSINLYSHSKSDIYPIRTTKSTAAKHIDLLVTSNYETNLYVWIRDFNKLCYNITKCKTKKFFCKHCIQHSPSQEKLEKHLLDCVVLTECQAIEMPPESEVTKFESLRETVKIPFVIYADFESLPHKLTVTQEQEMVHGMHPHSTEKLQKHVACSCGYKVVCCYDDRLSKPFKMYRGLDSVDKFFTDIFEEEKEILEKLKEFQKTPIKLSNEEKSHRKLATSCYVCKCSFTAENRRFVTIVMF